MHSVIKNGDTNAQVREFKRFVNEFGTHYSSAAEMGTRISIERRYSATERSGAEDNELKDCNTVAGTFAKECDPCKINNPHVSAHLHMTVI